VYCAGAVYVVPPLFMRAAGMAMAAGGCAVRKCLAIDNIVVMGHIDYFHFHN
jgi:hypothetical protein